ncbi:MAG: hypothetical protein ACK55Z_12250, partial [bacterium]
MTASLWCSAILFIANPWCRYIAPRGPASARKSWMSKFPRELNATRRTPSRIFVYCDSLRTHLLGVPS